MVCVRAHALGRAVTWIMDSTAWFQSHLPLILPLLSAGSQEDSDCCLHSDSMCLHKARSEPTASPVCCLFHADDLPFTARDSCVESQHGPSKKGFPVHYQKHVGHIGNAHPHSQTFKLILFTALASNASSPKRKSHLCLTQSSFAISVIGVTPVSHDC